MTAEKDDAPEDGTKAGDGASGRARPAKPPLTIDLTADAVGAASAEDEGAPETASTAAADLAEESVPPPADLSPPP